MLNSILIDLIAKELRKLNYIIIDEIDWTGPNAFVGIAFDVKSAITIRMDIAINNNILNVSTYYGGRMGIDDIPNVSTYHGGKFCGTVDLLNISAPDVTPESIVSTTIKYITDTRDNFQCD